MKGAIDFQNFRSQELSRSLDQKYNQNLTQKYFEAWKQYKQEEGLLDLYLKQYKDE